MICAQHIAANLVIQYSIVGIILLMACCWIAWKVFHKQKNSSCHCSGCSLADSCSKNEIIGKQKKKM